MILAPAARIARIVLLALLASASVAATQVDIVDLPLRPKDPNKPLEIIAQRSWSGADVKPTAPPNVRELTVGFAPMGGGRGAVTLVVDYVAYLTKPSEPAGGAIAVYLSCPQVLDGCAYSLDKSVVPFEDRFMARMEREVAGQKKVMVVGRESQSYTFTKDVRMRVDISVSPPRNLEPLQVTARLVRGDYERAAVPGQPTRIGALWKVVGGGLFVLALAAWWLRRR